MKLDAVQLDDDVTLLSLAGKLDAEAATKIEGEFLGYTLARKKPAVVDMTGVDFLASLGIRVLMASALGLNKLGMKLVLLNPQPLVEKTLRATGMHVVMAISHDAEAARKLALNCGPTRNETAPSPGKP